VSKSVSVGWRYLPTTRDTVERYIVGGVVALTLVPVTEAKIIIFPVPVYNSKLLPVLYLCELSGVFRLVDVFRLGERI
jgi:hypothetical protein